MCRSLADGGRRCNGHTKLKQPERSAPQRVFIDNAELKRRAKAGDRSRIITPVTPARKPVKRTSKPAPTQGKTTAGKTKGTANKTTASKARSAAARKPKAPTMLPRNILGQTRSVEEVRAKVAHRTARGRLRKGGILNLHTNFMKTRLAKQKYKSAKELRKTWGASK
jgi:hypothetical protein